jgi:hypothetical protein
MYISLIWGIICGLYKVKAKVILRPTVSRPVRLGVRRPSGTREQCFFLLKMFFTRLIGLLFLAPYLTRGRTCNFLLLLLPDVLYAFSLHIDGFNIYSIYSASNKNEYRESSCGVKRGLCVRLVTSPPSVCKVVRGVVGLYIILNCWKIFCSQKLWPLNHRGGPLSST